MPIRIHANWVQKAGNNVTEYEDAFAFRCCSQRSTPRNEVRVRCAIADGATDSWCSGLWASLLAEAASKGNLEKRNFPTNFERLRKNWQVEGIRGDMDWVSEEKSRGGAHAAVLWVEIVPPSKPSLAGRWAASAVGDCCLFQLRGGEVVTTFPYTTPEQFTSRPDLLGTAYPTEEATQGVEDTKGEWQPGDRFLLATDALAHWFLEQVDSCRKYSEEVLRKVISAQSQEAFNAWATDARQSGRLRNDDTTLVFVEMG